MRRLKKTSKMRGIKKSNSDFFLSAESRIFAINKTLNKMTKFTKTISANLVQVLAMLSAMVIFLGGWADSQGASPLMVKILGAIGAAISLLLSTPFLKTGTWSTKGWPVAMIIVNGLYLLHALTNMLGDFGFVGEATISLVAGLVNIIVSYLGTQTSDARVVTNNLQR
jgi:hypothetical protein